LNEVWNEVVSGWWVYAKIGHPYLILDRTRLSVYFRWRANPAFKLVKKGGHYGKVCALCKVYLFKEYNVCLKNFWIS